MPREFELPDVGEGVAEGELVEWLVDPGDTVTEDQAVAKVETDKALVDVPSPYDGTIKELRAEAGEMVPVGDVIMVYNVEGEDDLSDTSTAAETEAEAAADAPEDAAEAAATGGDTETVSTPEGRVFAAPSARRLARELGVDIDAVEGTGPSGRVTERDVRAHGGDDPDPEPEPATAEAEAGGDAASGAQSATERASDESEASTGGAAPASVESADRERTLAAPATRKLADEEGVDIDAVPTDETRDGEAFVTPEAVQEYAEAQRAAQEADAEAMAAGESAGPTTREPAAETTTEPYRGVRKTIGDAMADSKYTAPHVTHHDEVDVTKLVETRERLNDEAEDRGIHLTYMPFVMKACVAALKEYPIVNASLDEDNGEIVKHHYYNVGVATATDAGLMVPVVEAADRKGMLQISSEMNELVQKARERTISPEEMRGGTFTVTNIGGIGGEYATPIINHPESAILAVGQIKKKPRVVEKNGEDVIEPRHVLTLSLAFDHRIIDGADGARFTNEVMQYLENPELLLLE